MNSEHTQSREQEILPMIALDMEHRITLTHKQTELLLEERRQIIEESVETIQYNFFRIGKALAEIKRFRLYKSDPMYTSWKEYINFRIEPKLHQSTISDYIAIVQMQCDNKDFIQENELIQLGYKKVKLLKSKLNMIRKEKDLTVRRKLEDKFRTFYKQSFKEFRDLPYSTFEKALLVRIQNNNDTAEEKPVHTIEKENAGFKYVLDKKRNKITITSINPDSKKLESLFHLVSSKKDPLK